jgi:organic hydroperoxide reductase OsmC/OhrA
VASVRPRIFSYAVTLDRDRAAASDRGGAALPDDEDAWTPEHLVLTALARCVLASLDHHARRAGVTTVVAGATAAGKVTLREADERFAFVEVDVELAVELDPPHDREAARELVARAERDCFVAASLTVKPRYRWTVGGETLP